MSEKIIFNHQAKTFEEAVGLSVEKAHEKFKKTVERFINSFPEEYDIKESEVLEHLCNNLTVVELVMVNKGLIDMNVHLTQLLNDLTPSCEDEVTG